MAGMDWFRWHHGSVSDPKFQLVAKRSGASMGEVIAVWAVLLEAASMADVRGVFGSIDFEAIDCALGFVDGRTLTIYTEMEARNLICEGRFGAWDKRQPKRERDDNSAERVKAHRAKDNHVTPSNAKGNQETPRVDKRREEEKEQDQKPSSSASQRTGKSNLESNEQKRQRLIEITDDAVEAFNRILGRPVGLLPAVHPTVGKEKRRKEVGRILKVVRDICLDQYKDPHITKTFWEDYFSECERDDFKSGRQLAGKGHENWKPSFEYLTREAVVIEVFDKANSQDIAA